jgi:hypothetical protein
VSLFHDELTARIDSGEHVGVTRCWFLSALRDSETPWSELSPFEHEFLTQALNSYEAWQQARAREKAAT